MSTGVGESLRIATPEGVSLELPLAGVGSRFIALLFDTLLQVVTFTAVEVLMNVTGTGDAAVFAIRAITFFGLLLVYPFAFELAAGGRTPGKRWSSLRVICADGSPVTLRASALRNMLRLVDILPGMYLVGAIAIFVTRSNQRLGDLAGGTLVVREPRAARGAPEPIIPADEHDAGELPAWDVSGLGTPELAALRRFLERRSALDDVPRNLLARDLADRLRPRVGGVGGDLDPERFLELIAALRSIRV